MTCRNIVTLHRHTDVAETSEPVADQNERFRSRQRSERLTDQFKRTLDTVGSSPLPWIQALDQRRHRRRLYCRWPLEQQTVGEHAIEPLTVAGEVGPNLEVRIERQHGDTIVRSQRLQKMSALQEQPHQADDA